MSVDNKGEGSCCRLLLSLSLLNRTLLTNSISRALSAELLSFFGGTNVAYETAGAAFDWL